MKLTFDTEQKAIDVERQIWINYVKMKFLENKKLVGTGTVEYESLDGLTDNEIVELKIYGVKSGIIVRNNGSTREHYATINKAYQIDKWYFEKPDESLMTGVVDYQEEEFNPDWEEPVGFVQ